MSVQSGPELDLEVARAIGRDLLWVPSGEYSHHLGYFTAARTFLSDAWLDVAANEAVAKYSTDANAALEAYWEMRKRGWCIWKCQDYSHGGNPYWRIELARPSEEVQGDGPSFASALCAAIVEAGKR